MISLHLKDDILYIRLHYKGKRALFSTGYTIEPRQLKNGHVTVPDINRNVGQQKSRLEKIIRDLEYERPDRDFTLEDIKKRFHVTDNAPKDSLIDKIGQFILSRGDLAENTIKSYKNLKNHLIGFNQKLTLMDVDTNLYEDLRKYLWGQGLKNNSVIKLLTKLKALTAYFEKKGEKVNPNYKFYTERDEGKDALFLTKEELERFSQVELIGLYEKARDLFLFSCYTGLRYSDIETFHKSQIVGKFIKITQTKTRESATIPLNKYSVGILEKYNYKLPKLSLANCNLYIKIIADKAGITEEMERVSYRANERIVRRATKAELLTFHCGRATFIMLHMVKGVADRAVMKMTGHRDPRSFERYVFFTELLLEDIATRVFD